MVANESLEKARAYLSQTPGTDGLMLPPEGYEGNPSPQFYFMGLSAP